MEIIRSYIDRNRQLSIPPASTITDDNEHEIRCGMCAREISVDKDAYRAYAEALISGSENPFRCEICSEEY